MAYLVVFSGTGGDTHSINTWRLQCCEKFEEIADRLVSKSGPAAVERLILMRSRVYSGIEPHSTKYAPFCADELVLKGLEMIGRLNVSGWDRIKRTVESDGFKVMIQECMARLPEKLFPRELLDDLRGVDFNTLRSIALDKKITIDIICRDPERVNVAFKSMRLVIDFTQRSFWDVCTFNYIKSPCVVTLSIADILVDVGYYTNMMNTK